MVRTWFEALIANEVGCVYFYAFVLSIWLAGSAEKLYDSVTKKLFTLPESTTVYPGHDYKGRTASTIGEEK